MMRVHQSKRQIKEPRTHTTKFSKSFKTNERDLTTHQIEALRRPRNQSKVIDHNPYHEQDRATKNLQVLPKFPSHDPYISRPKKLLEITSIIIKPPHHESKRTEKIGSAGSNTKPTSSRSNQFSRPTKPRNSSSY